MLLGVTAARAEVGAIRASPERLNNPEAFKQFQRAQDELSGALSRLLVVVERYPDLKSDQNFRDLQAELGGTDGAQLTTNEARVTLRAAESRSACATSSSG